MTVQEDAHRHADPLRTGRPADRRPSDRGRSLTARSFHDAGGAGLCRGPLESSSAHRGQRSTPEELELDVVRIAEGEHRVGRVVELLDTRVHDAHIVEPSGPLEEIVALCYDEFEMVESRSMLIELVTGIPGVTHQAQHELADRLDEADVAHALVVRRVVVGLLHAQEFAVPRRASLRIADREGDLEATGDRRHATLCQRRPATDHVTEPTQPNLTSQCLDPSGGVRGRRWFLAAQHGPPAGHRASTEEPRRRNRPAYPALSWGSSQSARSPMN